MQILDKYPERTTSYRKHKYSDSRKLRCEMRVATEEALKATTKPLLEVGGPSTGGFIALDGLKLPHGIIISNIDGNEGASIRADIRNLPFANQSLGGIVMKALTPFPEEVAEAQRPGRVMQDIGNTLRLLMASANKDYSGWTDPEVIGFSQHIALLKEARRTVEPNGILLATRLSSGGIQLAEELGFELTASTIKNVDTDLFSHERNVGEFLLTLTNLDTPAGKIAELPSPFRT
jgi:hypothetical protein